jgi:hypothetical protein
LVAIVEEEIMGEPAELSEVGREQVAELAQQIFDGVADDTGKPADVLRRYVERNGALPFSQLMNEIDMSLLGLAQEVLRLPKAVRLPDRHLTSIDLDRESARRGGSTRTALCTCGWQGPQRGTIELAVDDALGHERAP